MILAGTTLTSLWLGCAAAVAYAVPAAAASQLSVRAAQGALMAAWLLHAGMLVHGLVADTPRFVSYVRHAATRYAPLAPLARLFDELEERRPQVGYTF